MLTALLIACSAPPPSEPAEPATPAPPAPAPVVQRQNDGRRIIAIGDLHGDRDAALKALQLAGIANADGHWTGGDTVFVQTGDTTDRGPDSKGVIDLVRQLAEEAPAHGGEVHLLLGNHEVMNLQGDWRYVSPEDIDGFGGKRRRTQAFSRAGEYGRFLAGLPMVAKVDDTVFVHGGITPKFAEKGVAGINAEAKAHYFDALTDKAKVNDEDGPIWYRGYVRRPEAEACPDLERALEALDAKRMVVGHTTRRDGKIEGRCGGRLAVIDVGISAHYGGHLAVWESLNGDSLALTPEGRVDLADPK